MAIQISNLRDQVRDLHVRTLLYGMSGAGKTYSIGTCPAPTLLVEAEGGQLSLVGKDVDCTEVHNLQDVYDLLEWAYDSEEAKRYGTIAVDSVSEIAEVVLAAEKEANKDPRKAYANMGDTLAKIIRSFRDIPDHNVIVIAKADQKQDETGALLYQPSVPGSKATLSLPYFFDEVLAMRVTRDDDGLHRWFQTSSDGLWVAKDRSGRLDPGGEPADFTRIFGKITGKAQGEEA